MHGSDSEAELELLHELLSTGVRPPGSDPPRHRATVEDDPEELPLPQAPASTAQEPPVRTGSRRSRHESEEDSHEPTPQMMNGTPFASARSSPVSTPPRPGTPMFPPPLNVIGIAGSILM